MEIKLKGNKLIIEEKLKTCRSCAGFMMPWYKEIPWVHSMEIKKIVPLESYHDSGVCEACILKGGFPRECCICNVEKEFPKDFSYILTWYARHCDEGTEYGYISSEWVRDSCQELITLMTDASEIEKLVDDKIKN